MNSASQRRCGAERLQATGNAHDLNSMPCGALRKPWRKLLAKEPPFSSNRASRALQRLVPPPPDTAGRPFVYHKQAQAACSTLVFTIPLASGPAARHEQRHERGAAPRELLQAP